MTDQSKDDKRKTHERVIARLRDQSDDVRRLSSGLDEAALGRRVKPEKWSLKELVCHVLRVQEVFEKRLEAMLAEENPAMSSYGPEGDPEFEPLAALPAERSLAQYLDGRRRLLARLEKIDAAAWHRTGRHPDYPRYDVHFAMEYLAHHEAHHIYQMYERRAPLGPVPH